MQYELAYAISLKTKVEKKEEEKLQSRVDNGGDRM